MKDSTKDAWIKVIGMKKNEFFAPDSFKAVVICSEWRNKKKIKNEDIESSGNIDENEGKGNEPKKGGLKTGVIVAIIVVIVVVVAAVVVGVLLYLRYKKREISSGEENAIS
ncbi:hypothetical protein M9Y10_026241 [Tritrichomonas musculus]|uniref:Uncharacterized protein n=1 Tax=Tritrichomonas musculus TaxID=1915356 RepID=A0ABR2H752_9EUKA